VDIWNVHKIFVINFLILINNSNFDTVSRGCFTSIAVVQEVIHRLMIIEAVATNDADFERVEFIKLYKPKARITTGP
jgi:hypothetical protein